LVVNVGVKVDGKKSLFSKARRIKEYELRLSDGKSVTIVSKLDDFNDINPFVSAALLKACIKGMNILEFPSSKSLSEQLSALGGGFEVECRSALSTGSGCGASSILAATIVQAIAPLFAKQYSVESLNHLILQIEQILTTGGGWQDQVGGIVPEFKASVLDKATDGDSPLTVKIEKLHSPTSINIFNNHGYLIYTGTSRLASNLLETVLRSWWRRQPEIVQVFNDLIKNAEQMKTAIIKGDIEAIGKSLSTYWNQKKTLAEGAEPYRITKLMEILKPYIHGCTLLGAGGGGYMLIITKEPHFKNKLEQILTTNKLDDQIEATVHEITVDTNGLEHRILD